MVLFELPQPLLAELWQDSWLRSAVAKVFAMPLPLPMAGLLQATHSPELALSSLCSTSLHIPAVVSWEALSCKDNLADVLSLTQDSCKVEAVNSQMGPNNNPGCVHFDQNVLAEPNHHKINDSGWKIFSSEPLRCLFSIAHFQNFDFPDEMPVAWDVFPDLPMFEEDVHSGEER
uniref:Uncharacterized protein n=1 Tax=Pipistrellus kuhlii TaxID=59472 RepID=A0A7J8A821_PIPKU|nr:hypothetical protein mPipKuh1_008815 [Pipistrellus kuhlii]